MARRSRFPRPSQSPKRLTTWSKGPDEVDRTTTGSGQVIWSLGLVPLQSGLTIVRIRGMMSLTLTVATAIGDGFVGASGICLVSDEATAIGATAVPGPISEADWDGWMWHQFWDVRAVTATIADGVNAHGASKVLEIDSKAMRKLPDGWTLIGVTEVVESGTASVEIQAKTRMLFKV